MEKPEKPGPCLARMRFILPQCVVATLRLLNRQTQICLARGPDSDDTG